MASRSQLLPGAVWKYQASSPLAAWTPARIDAVYKLSPSPLPRRARYHAVGLPVPKYNKSSRRIVGHALPRGASSAAWSTTRRFTFVPRAHCRRLETLGGIAGHRVSAPDHLAGVGIVGGNITAHAVLRSGIANHDQVLGDPWSAGDRISFVALARHHTPHGSSRAGIERDQACIECSPTKILPMVERNPTIDHVSAKEIRMLARQIWGRIFQRTSPVLASIA